VPRSFGRVSPALALPNAHLALARPAVAIGVLAAGEPLAYALLGFRRYVCSGHRVGGQVLSAFSGYPGAEKHVIDTDGRAGHQRQIDGIARPGVNLAQA